MKQKYIRILQAFFPVLLFLGAMFFAAFSSYSTPEKITQDVIYNGEVFSFYIFSDTTLVSVSEDVIRIPFSSQVFTVAPAGILYIVMMTALIAVRLYILLLKWEVHSFLFVPIAIILSRAKRYEYTIKRVSQLLSLKVFSWDFSYSNRLL